MASIDSFSTGSITVGTSAVQMPSNPVPNGVWVKAAAANANNVFVGSSSAVTGNGTDATDGYQLDGGEEVFIPVNNTDAIWLIAGAVSQEVFFLIV